MEINNNVVRMFDQERMKSCGPIQVGQQLSSIVLLSICKLLFLDPAASDCSL